MKDTTRKRANRILFALLSASLLSLPLIGCGRSGNAPDPEASPSGPAHAPDRQPPREVPRQAPPEEPAPTPPSPPPGN